MLLLLTYFQTILHDQIKRTKCIIIEILPIFLYQILIIHIKTHENKIVRIHLLLILLQMLTRNVFQKIVFLTNYTSEHTFQLYTDAMQNIFAFLLLLNCFVIFNFLSDYTNVT